MGGTKYLLSPTPKNMGGTCPPVPHPNKAHALNGWNRSIFNENTTKLYLKIKENKMFSAGLEPMQAQPSAVEVRDTTDVPQGHILRQNLICIVAALFIELGVFTKWSYMLINSFERNN